MADKQRELDKLLKTYNDIIEVSRTQNSLLEKQIQYTKDIVLKEQKSLEIKQNEKTILEAEAKSNEVSAKYHEKEIKYLKDSLDFKQKSSQLSKEEEEFLKKQIESEEKLQGLAIKNAEEKGKILSQLEQQANLVKKIGEYQNDLDKKTSEIAEKLFDINKSGFEKSLLGIVTRGREIGVSLGDSLKNVGRSFLDSVNSSNIFDMALRKTIDLNTQLDTVQSDFSKQTGTGGQYNQMIKNMGREHLSLGIDMKGAEEALISLKAQFTDFSMLDKRTKEEVALLTAGLKQLGVATDITAKSFQITQKMLGMTASESIKVQKELLAEARALEIAPSQIMEEFSKVMPNLVAFGAKSVQIFKDLTAASKSTGIEISKLVKFAEGFETFAGAAERGGQLNAILGNMVDVVQLTDIALKQGPMGTLKYLKERFDATGMSIDSMTMAQKKAIANAAKFEDVDMFVKFMTSDLNKMSEASKQEAMQQEKMNEMMRQAQPVTDKLKQLMMSFTIALGPVVDKIRTLLDWLMKTNEKMGGWLGYIALAIAGVVVLSHILFPVVNIIKTFSGGVGDLSNQMAKANPLLMESGKASAYSSVKFFGLAAIIASVGIAIFLATKGIASLATSFKDLSGKQILGIIGTLAIVAGLIAIVGNISAAATGPALAFGEGMLMIGGAIGIIFASLSLFVYSLKGLFTLLIEHVTIIPKLAGGVALLGAGLMGLGVGAIIAGASLPVLALGLGLLAVSLWAIKTKDLEALGMIFSAMSKFTSTTVNNVRNISSEIREMAKALDKIPIAKTIMLTSSIKQIADSSAKLNESKAAANGNIVNKIENVMNKGNETKEGKAGTDNGMRTINLNIDGRLMKRFVLDVLNNELSPRKVVY